MRMNCGVGQVIHHGPCSLSVTKFLCSQVVVMKGVWLMNLYLSSKMLSTLWVFVVSE